MNIKIEIEICPTDPEPGLTIYPPVDGGIDVAPYSVGIVAGAKIGDKTNREWFDNFADMSTWIRGVTDFGRDMDKKRPATF